MQSHASRHVVSEHLKDLHPNQSSPFPTGIVKDEIATAYGRRGIRKMIDVLALPASELSPDESQRAHALRVFNSLLCAQEQKSDAISQGAALPLTTLVTTSKDPEVIRLSCEALGSLVQVFAGRAAVLKAEGLPALTDALTTSPEAAAGAIRRFVSSNDGVLTLMAHPSLLGLIVTALVGLAGRLKEGSVTTRAYENAAAALAGLSTTDQGVAACLANEVPQVIISLLNRGLEGDLRYEPSLMDLIEQCCACLAQICHHPEGRKAVREQRGIQALAGVLVAGQFCRGPLKTATSALMAASIEKESKVLVMSHAGEHLVRLLKGQDDQLTPNARFALASSCEHLEARRALGLLLDEEEQASLLFQGPLPPTPPDFRYKVLMHQ